MEASLAARRDDLDRLVIEHVEGLAELRRFADEVNESTPMDEIQTKAKNVHPFRTFPGVLDRLSREGAIDPQLKSRATKVADEYQKAVEAELRALGHRLAPSWAVQGDAHCLLLQAGVTFGYADPRDGDGLALAALR